MQEAHQSVEIEILLPSEFGDPFDLRHHLQPSFDVPVFVRERHSMRDYGERFSGLHEDFARSFHELCTEMAEHLRQLMDEVNISASRELTETDKAEKADLERFNHNINRILLCLHSEPIERNNSEFSAFVTPGIDVSHLFPQSLRLLDQGVNAVDIFLKSPVGGAVAGALATKVLDAMVDWAKKHKANKDETEIRFFGPEGNLIQMKKVKKGWF
jgi:hypothetical protein